MGESGEKWEMLFLGTYKHIIDEKNRLSLPAKLVNKFSNDVVVASKGFEGCLELRSREDFSVWSGQILSYSQNKKDSRILARQILANSSELELDKANRILIPDVLKKLANLKKNVIIIGLGNKLEVWDAKAYAKFQAETNNKFEAVAERIDDEHANK